MQEALREQRKEVWRPKRMMSLPLRWISRLVGRCFAFFCSWLVNLPPLNVFPLGNRRGRLSCHNCWPWLRQESQVENQSFQWDKYHFQTVIVIKLLVMDIPQQAMGFSSANVLKRSYDSMINLKTWTRKFRLGQEVCIVLYLLGWYEEDGLRCQLCLFHPQHCEDEDAFGLVNSVTWHKCEAIAMLMV